MTTLKHPNGATYVSPYLTVLDVVKAAEFYTNAFGFEVKEIVPAHDHTALHGELKYADQLIMLGKQGAYGSETLAPAASKVKSPMSLYIYCDDVDAFYQKAVAAGAISIKVPEDTFWGDRMCALECSNGYHWCFATHLGN